jgi:hypothetical protein
VKVAACADDGAMSSPTPGTREKQTKKILA